MKKKLSLFLLALVATIGAWAETITWESKSGWTQASGGKAGLEWFGATTPGSTTTEFTLTEFQIMHEVNTSMVRYIAIATSYSTTTLNEADVVAVSNNSITPSAVQLYTYTFDNTVTLTGGTTYYIVFLTSNTPTNGAYPVGAGRVALNHTDYGTYAPGCSYSGGGTWWPYYKATLTSSVSMINVTYNLYESDGTTSVSSETVSQEPSSAVNIPSSLRYDYYYNYTTEGTIGTTDCTIKVTRTLKNANIVNPLTGLNNNKSYYIKTRENKRYELSTYTSGETTYLAAVVKSSLNISAKKFAIINYEGNNYLYSVDDAKFVTYAGVSTEAPLANTVTGTRDRIVFSLTTSPLYEIRFDGSTSKIFNASNSQAYPYGLVFNTWGASSSQWDDGCQYTIEEAEAFDPTAALAALEEFFHHSYTVTYKVKDVSGNVLFTSEPIGTELGANITTLPAEFKRDFCTYNSVDVTISQPSTTVEFTATYSGLPFVLSPSYDEATWYNMSIRGTKYVSKGDSEPYSLGTATIEQKNEDNYRWAFSGNPYALVVYNKASGNGNTLTKDGENAVMRSGSYTWTLCKNNDGFTLKVTGTDNTYVNDVNSTLKFWDNASAAADNGSTFRVEDVVDNYYDFVKAEALPYIFANTEDLAQSEPSETIGKPFGIKQETAAAIVQTYASQLSAQTFTYQEYQDIVSAKDAGIIYPENGKFYVIKNVSNNKYLNVKSAGGIYADVDAPVAGSIVQAIVRDSKTYFATQGLELGWCYTASYAALLDAAGAGKYAHFSITVPGQVAFAHCLGNGEGSNAVYLPYSYYSVNESNQVVGSASTAATAQWIFEEAETFTIPLNGVGGSYYATFCVPFDVTLDDATTAYTLDRGEGTELTMSAITEAVDAGTPVLLVGTSGSATATIGTNYTTTPVSGTALTGTYLEIANFDGAANYVLGKDGDNVGFYHWAGTKLNANRAYIAGSGSGVKGFALNFDDDATAIKDLNDLKDSNGLIFNLAGQRISKMQKGINIMNGKKIVVK